MIVQGNERIFYITLFKDGSRWGTGFLHERNGTIACLNIADDATNKRFNAGTLPDGVKVCPELADGRLASPQVQAAITKVARNHGYMTDFDVF